MAPWTHAVVDTADGRVYAGKCVETVVAGAHFLVLTVPSGALIYFRGESLAAITPCTPAFAKAAGQALAQPLAHIHIPEAASWEDGSAAGGAKGAAMTGDEAIYQHGYDDGYLEAMAEVEEARAAAEAEASLASIDDDGTAAINRERQRVLLPGDDGFPMDLPPSFLRDEAA